MANEKKKISIGDRATYFYIKKLESNSSLIFLDNNFI